MRTLRIMLSGAIVVSVFVSFAQEDKKASKARQELSEAKADSAADFLKFKQEAETNISENKQKITVLKTKKLNADKAVNEKYDKKIMVLEQKNNALKKQIDECNTTKTSTWASFKARFNRDMNALGDALTHMEIEMYEMSK